MDALTSPLLDHGVLKSILWIMGVLESLTRESWVSRNHPLDHGCPGITDPRIVGVPKSSLESDHGCPEIIPESWVSRNQYKISQINADHGCPEITANRGCPEINHESWVSRNQGSISVFLPE